eukprot:6004090-Pleurochrysis_carterae.AAC.1
MRHCKSIQSPTSDHPCLTRFGRACLCGMISPKMTMQNVAMRPPKRPEVICAEKMEMSALTSVFPSSSVQSSRLPRLRTG